MTQICCATNWTFPNVFSFPNTTVNARTQRTVSGSSIISLLNYKSNIVVKWSSLASIQSSAPVIQWEWFNFLRSLMDAPRGRTTSYANKPAPPHSTWVRMIAKTKSVVPVPRPLANIPHRVIHLCTTHNHKIVQLLRYTTTTYPFYLQGATRFL